MFSGAAVSSPSTSLGPPKFPVLCWSLLPSLLCSLPTPSLIIPLLPFSPFLFAASEALNSPGRERRASTRGKAAVRVEEKREMVEEEEEEENKSGVSHPRARKLSSKSAPLSAPGNPREVRASTEIIEFLLLGRPLSTVSPSLLLSTSCSISTSPKIGIHIYPRFFLRRQAYICIPLAPSIVHLHVGRRKLLYIVWIIVIRVFKIRGIKNL